MRVPAARGTGAFGLVLLPFLLVSACSPADPSPVEPTPMASYGGGPISEAQYLTIVRGVRECMIEKGFEADEVEKRLDGVTYGFTFSGGSGPSDGSDLVECEQQHGLMEAELAFQDQQALSGADREAVYAELIACLDAAGVPGATSSMDAPEVGQLIGTHKEAGEDVADAERCLTAYSAKLFGSSA